MKNRMDVPQEYEPVLPGKAEAHLAKKKAQAAENSLLTQTAIAVGKVIGQLELERPISFDTFDMQRSFTLMNSEISNPLVLTTSLTSFPASRKRALMIDLIGTIGIVLIAKRRHHSERPTIATSRMSIRVSDSTHSRLTHCTRYRD